MARGKKVAITFTEQELDALFSLCGETLDHPDAIERWRSFDMRGLAAGLRAYNKVKQAMTAIKR